MKSAETHTVETVDCTIRLSDYAGGIFELIPSRKGMKKAIDKGFVWVNGTPATTGKWITNGDVIDLRLPSDFQKAYERTVEVVYEDDYLAVVNKPAGILTNGNSFKTLENTLPFNLSKSAAKDALWKPQVAHRLDFATSGLVLVGKTRSSTASLKEAFKDRLVQKTYHALTVGKMKQSSGVLDDSIDGKSATSEFNVIQAHPSNKYEFINLVQLKPITGRRNQLRVHLANLGHPILGDRKFGNALHWDMKRGLYLAATTISFNHPTTQESLIFSIDLPKKFQKLLR